MRNELLDRLEKELISLGRREEGVSRKSKPLELSSSDM
jgi:hypothetical protein